jgi:hypothetical protein
MFLQTIIFNDSGQMQIGYIWTYNKAHNGSPIDARGLGVGFEQILTYYKVGAYLECSYSGYKYK